MFQEIIKAFLLIFIAEMGDKTQILAMAFATRYPVKKVLIGIGLGSFLNHGLAVLLGSFLSNFIPIENLQIIAGVAFIFFAIWTLKAEDADDEEETKTKFGPIGTVTLAFFLGELGDKTQLTAITLATDATFPYMILVGTVAGMIATGLLGIIVGKKLGDKIPEIGIKLFATSIFLFFGLQKLYQTLPANLLTKKFVLPFLLLLGTVLALMLIKLFRDRKKGIQSDFVIQSKLIHDYNEHIEADLDHILFELEQHNISLESDSPVKHAKELIGTSGHQLDALFESGKIINSNNINPHVEGEIIDSIVDTLYLFHSTKTIKGLNHALLLRKQLEFILMDRYLKTEFDITAYFEELHDLNPNLEAKISKEYRMRKSVSERIINLGNEQHNIYLVEIKSGYLLIDTGYEHQYKQFLKALEENHISIDEITYVFITHTHEHHVGFLHQFLTKTNAKIILHTNAILRLKDGINNSKEIYANKFSSIFYLWKRFIGRKYKPSKKVIKLDRYIQISNDDNQELPSTLNAEVYTLPGHSEDSIGIVLEDHSLFCGDALMNRFSGRNHLAMRIESLDDYKKTLEKLQSIQFKKVYPSHGKPFTKTKLIKERKILNQIGFLMK